MLAAAAFFSIIVGVVEVGPNRCEVNLLNPDRTIDTFVTTCSYIVNEHVIIPFRAPYGP